MFNKKEYSRKYYLEHAGKNCPIRKDIRHIPWNKGIPCSEKQKKAIGDANRGSNNYRWKGGKSTSNGYIIILQPNGEYIREHRLVMAKHLGRPLKSWEIVHHINGVKTDNRIENLELLLATDHQIITALEKENKRLREKIKNLEIAKLNGRK